MLDPMASGDGWLLRVRVPGGAIDPSALRTVASVAERHGSGAVEITSRANLQLRGLRPERLDAAAGELVDAGLAADDARTDARRAVVASPLTGHDPDAVTDGRAELVAAVDALVRLDVEVPSKFGVVLDDGGSWPLDALDADIRLGALGGGWSVTVRGSAAPVGVVPAAAGAVVGAAAVCAAHAARMDVVVRDLGIDALLVAMGAGALPDADTAPARPLGSDLVGRRPHPQRGRGSLVAAPFLGRLAAPALIAVADLSERAGADLRLTPARSVAFCGVMETSIGPLADALTTLGWITDPTDPRARVSACVGSSGCAAASVDTRAHAERLARDLQPRERVHLSACAKACGAPRGVRHLLARASGQLEPATAP